ncbi:MAG: alpha-D-glucose phosphate-specific phosphoglucomutase, partial [Leptospirillum sp.]
ARMHMDPAESYRHLCERFGSPAYRRIDAPASDWQKSLLKNLTPEKVRSGDLAGEKILECLTKAPGNGQSIGGLKVVTKSGWFAARPSGTESIYKIYAESFLGEEHLSRILSEAQEIVNKALSA